MFHLQTYFLNFHVIMHLGEYLCSLNIQLVKFLECYLTVKGRKIEGISVYTKGCIKGYIKQPAL